MGALGRVELGGCEELLAALPKQHFRLVYIDPPFNTGKRQIGGRVKVVRDEEGERIGFAGKRYRSERAEGPAYRDRRTGFVAWLIECIREALPAMSDDASLFVHLDAKEAHYVKVALDELLGRDHFMNEIIWAYDFGGRSKRRWPAKHDTILWYTRDPSNYVFDYDAIDRIPYMAPGLQTKARAAKGKTPTDVWWHTIVPTNGSERTGYPTQKPLGVLRRIIRVHSEPGDHVLDFFAGSGTTGEAAALEGRNFHLIDESPDAIAVMKERLALWLK